MTAAAAVAVEAANTNMVGEFRADTSGDKFPFTSRISHLGSISELDLNAFRVALVPFSNQGIPFRGSEEHGVSDRMVILPMTLSQLVAQVRKETIHLEPSPKPDAIEFGDVTVDLFSIQVRRSGQLIDLTKLEFNVLRFFVLNPNRVISREELLNQVWGYENYPCTRTVDNHILKLRNKFEPDARNPVHFSTVHGIGYKFTPEVCHSSKS